MWRHVFVDVLNDSWERNTNSLVTPATFHIRKNLGWLRPGKLRPRAVWPSPGFFSYLQQRRILVATRLVSIAAVGCARAVVIGDGNGREPAQNTLEVPRSGEFYEGFRAG